MQNLETDSPVIFSLQIGLLHKLYRPFFILKFLLDRSTLFRRAILNSVGFRIDIAVMRDLEREQKAVCCPSVLTPGGLPRKPDLDPSSNPPQPPQLPNPAPPPRLLRNIPSQPSCNPCWLLPQAVPSSHPPTSALNTFIQPMLPPPPPNRPSCVARAEGGAPKPHRSRLTTTRASGQPLAVFRPPVFSSTLTLTLFQALPLTLTLTPTNAAHVPSVLSITPSLNPILFRSSSLHTQWGTLTGRGRK